MAAPKGNKFALGLTTSGRPPNYDDPEKLHNKCEEYFLYCIDNKEKITITGLALYLGFNSRDTIYEYQKKKEFSDIIKRAMLVVENRYEEQTERNPAGAIFVLKNMGWKDKTESDVNHSGSIIVKPPRDVD